MTFEPAGPTDVVGITASEPPPPGVVSESWELRFESGYRTEETVDKLSDQLNFTRACPALLRTIIAASMFSFREGLRRDLGITSASQLAVGEGDFDAQPALVRVGDHSPAPPGRAVGVAQPPPAQPSARR